MSDGGGGGGKKRRAIEEEHEEHENHERWLVSYADMMTLLMVLFIVMFAISQVDTRKFAALKTGLSAGFGAPVALLAGGDTMLDSGGAVAPDSINLAGNAGNDRSKSFTPNTTASEEQVAKLAKATEQAQVKREVENLQKAEQQLKEALQKAGMSKKAEFRFNERGLVVTVATDNVLFPSGSADLQPQGQAVLNVLAPTLKKLPNNLSIEGHTDSNPISTERFPSNWELSGDRASGVLRYLHAQDGIPYSRMSATGYADTEPRVKGTSAADDDKNRRVEIIVLARVDNSAGRAVAELGNDDSGTSSSSSTSETTQDTESSDSP
ncbi:flagellar motor protein MotB [Spongisporangium articulatum]|uniref:Flagellar motor protein MotB n=1 Tax=Spongisporangium articulatum TaxID=3362603 RepID=A0ABW8AHP5_9ACTN